MCEYVSVVATTEGPLKFYAAPGLNSHGDARDGWKLTKDKGAEVEWIGETHDYLSVRHEKPLVAKTIKQMIIDNFPNRSALLATITETRGPNNSVAFYKSGNRIITLADGGPNFEEVNKLFDELPGFPWAKPTSEVSEEILTQLVSEHLFNLGKYNKNPEIFDNITIKIVNTWAARGAAYDAAYGAAYDAACNAAYLISGLGNNPSSSLVEIYALGCFPVGIVDDEFVVFIPPSVV